MGLRLTSASREEQWLVGGQYPNQGWLSCLLPEHCFQPFSWVRGLFGAHGWGLSAATEADPRARSQREGGTYALCVCQCTAPSLLASSWASWSAGWEVTVSLVWTWERPLGLHVGYWRNHEVQASYQRDPSVHVFVRGKGRPGDGVNSGWTG